MSDAVIFDAGPLGVLVNPNKTSQPMAIRAWVAALLGVGRRVIIPEIADYEVRRELARIRSRSAIANLDAYDQMLEYLPLSTIAMRQAADLWAQARNTGQQTAPNLALDCDVILAAQAQTLGVPFLVATGNPAHLSRFVPAELWQNIVP
jgi:predicted nucleic acid-binding protein